MPPPIRGSGPAGHPSPSAGARGAGPGGPIQPRVTRAEDAFRSHPDDVQRFTHQARGTNAAVTVNGRRLPGARVRSSGRVPRPDGSGRMHAEEVVVSRDLDEALAEALRVGTRENPAVVRVVVNRSTCDTCSPLLARTLRERLAGLTPDQRASLRFELNMRGAYEGRGPLATGPGTRTSHVEDLIDAGWDVRALSVGGDLLPRGEALGEAAARLHAAAAEGGAAARRAGSAGSPARGPGDEVRGADIAQRSEPGRDLPRRVPGAGLRNYTPATIPPPANAGSHVPLPPQLQDAVRGVNPTGGSVNCLSCAVVTEGRLAGQLTSAMPDAYMEGVPRTIERLQELYGRPATGHIGPQAFAEIEARLLAAGDGARGIIAGYDDVGQYAHAVNVVNHRGAIWYVDGQVERSASLRGYNLLRFIQTSP